MKHMKKGCPPGGRRRFLQCIAIMGMIVCMMACLCACGEEEEAVEEPTTFELALVTDETGVNDGSFHQETWAAMEAFGEENGMTCQYYESANDEESYLNTIQEAKDQGAKLVVLAGGQFETICYEAQKKYPDLYFVLIDGVPRDSDYKYETAANTTSVLFAEEEAGYMAGYAAVCEGYTKLGFMGGSDLPPVKRYGYGFIQGVSAAAKERGSGQIDILYTYTGTFEANDEIESEAFKWYSENGTQVIFGCGGSIGESIMAAAETAGGAVIGVDADQSAMSETVITSAEKEIGRAVTDILKNYKRNNFNGGAYYNYSADNNGIGLEMTNSRMTVFTEEEYKALYKSIKDGDRTIVKDLEKKGPKSLAGDNVKVEIVKN